MEQLGSHWMDFHEIWYLMIFRKTPQKISVSLKSDKNKGHFTWRPKYIFILCNKNQQYTVQKSKILYHISLISS